ncbi:MAG: hypothetical protein A3D92_20765 [Bacteroidetes bacterium RIFCSPHIGHO2_02_FULL_44_7]|nr:MAG: hypothetical protein A3D92_20765 [Bacteroidetes bacterium RIFCSPHIGHO2_02_FULL_44_7]
MKRILLVDDLAEFVEVEKAYLNEYDESFDIETLSDPEEAMALLEKKNFDLIVMDIMMPRKDGLTLLREIRRKYDIPVIIYSAYVHLYQPTELLEQGADCVVSKPANMEFLINQIRDL